MSGKYVYRLKFAKEPENRPKLFTGIGSIHKQPEELVFGLSEMADVRLFCRSEY